MTDNYKNEIHENSICRISLINTFKTARAKDYMEDSGPTVEEVPYRSCIQTYKSRYM